MKDISAELSGEQLAPADLRAKLEARAPSVPTVDDSGFDTQALVKDDHRRAVLVQFFVRNSPPCHAAAAALELVARSGRNVIKLDCEAPESTTTAKRFAIGALPSILLFRGGKLIADYRGKLEADEIEEWLTRMIGPIPLPEELSDEELRARIESTAPSVPSVDDQAFETDALSTADPRRFVIVHFFSRKSPPCHTAARVLEQVARAGRHVLKLDCDAPESRATARRFAIGALPSILLFRGGKLQANYRRALTFAAIEEWVSRHAGPLPIQS